MTPRVLTLAALFLTLASGIVVGQEPPRIEDIRAAWDERQAKAQSLRIEWKQTDFVVKGGNSGALKLMMAAGESPAITPPADLTYTSSPTLILDDDKVAFSFLRRFWNTKIIHVATLLIARDAGKGVRFAHVEQEHSRPNHPEDDQSIKNPTTHVRSSTGSR